MSLTPYEKIRITKYIKEYHGTNNSYSNITKFLSSKNKISLLDIINFLIFYVNELISKEKIALNVLDKTISFLYDYLNELNSSQEKINCNEFIVFYDKYKNLKLPNNSLLEEIYSKIFSLNVQNQMENNVAIEIQDSNDKWLVEKEKYEKEINKLNKKLLDQKQKNREYISEIDRINLQNQQLRQEKENLQQTIRETEERISELKKQIQILEDTIANNDRKNESQISFYKKQLDDYQKIKHQLQELKKIIESYRFDNDNNIKNTKSIILEKYKEEQIKKILMHKITSGEFNTIELINFLKIKGFDITEGKLNKLLLEIQLELETNQNNNLLSNSFEKYSVSELEENTFDISVSNDSTYYDFLMVSDFHISLSDNDYLDELKRDFTSIYDYAVKYNINTIINAGDFFSFSKNIASSNEEIIDLYEKIIFKLVELYPKVDNIEQIVIGGNHDISLKIYNPLESFISEREDFRYLGNYHAYVNFVNDNKLYGKIGIHHPRKRFDDNLSQTYLIRKMVENYYMVSKSDRNKIYMDFLGHFHKSMLDTKGGICIVPSYRKDRICNGAWHVRVCFDKNKINQIILRPLMKQNQLVPATEIIYKKKKRD